MPEEIRYPAALNGDGDLVFISDAPAEGPFFCPGCHQQMVPRRGRIKVWHFAHLPGSVCADPDTALHSSAKMAIAQGIARAITDRVPYEVRYTCRFCGEQHALDLSAPGRTVHMEKTVGPARADIAVLEGAEVVAIIEVIVTHEPTEQVFDSYTHQTHPVAFIAPSWSQVEELRKHTHAILLLGGEPLCPSRRNFVATYVPRAQAAARVRATTTANSCPHCGGMMAEKDLQILDDYECYRCGKPMGVAIWDSDVTSSASHGLSTLLQKWGVKTRWEYSRTAGHRYLMNICPHCGAKIGDFYLRFELDQNPVVIDERVLLRCDACDEWHIGPPLLAKPRRQHELPPDDLGTLKLILSGRRREASSEKKAISKMKPIIEIIESVAQATGANGEVTTDTRSGRIDVFLNRADTKILFGLYNKWPGEGAIAARVAEMAEKEVRSVNLCKSMPQGYIISPELWAFGLNEQDDGYSVDLGDRHIPLSRATKLFLDGDVAFRQHMSFSKHQRIDLDIVTGYPIASRPLGKYRSVCGCEIPSTAILYIHPDVRGALLARQNQRSDSASDPRWLDFQLTKPFGPVRHPHWCIRSEEGFCYDGDSSRGRPLGF